MARGRARRRPRAQLLDARLLRERVGERGERGERARRVERGEDRRAREVDIAFY